MKIIVNKKSYNLHKLILFKKIIIQFLENPENKSKCFGLMFGKRFFIFIPGKLEDYQDGR